MSSEHTDPVALDALDRRLLDDFQRGFPLVPAPFAEIAARLGCNEGEVIERLRALRASGAVSRVGAVFRPRAVAASTLAAMAVPPERLDAVAAVVSGYRAVNHNYEREHRVNLWFVVNAPDDAGRDRVLANVAARTGIKVMSLPMLEDYHIDLGFRMDQRPEAVPRRVAPRAPETCALGAAEHRVAEALQGGLALVARPYRALARAAGLDEAQAIDALAALLARGVIKRLGVVVRHHELGYRANAMAVWDAPDERAGPLGRRMAELPFVTLCYRRARHRPEWPYNLYCMIHGRHRATVRAQLAELATHCGLDAAQCEVLFSRRRFKQRGALPFGAGRIAAA